MFNLYNKRRDKDDEDDKDSDSSSSDSDEEEEGGFLAMRATGSLRETSHRRLSILPEAAEENSLGSNSNHSKSSTAARKALTPSTTATATKPPLSGGVGDGYASDTSSAAAADEEDGPLVTPTSAPPPPVHNLEDDHHEDTAYDGVANYYDVEYHEEDDYDMGITGPSSAPSRHDEEDALYDEEEIIEEEEIVEEVEEDDPNNLIPYVSGGPSSASSVVMDPPRELYSNDFYDEESVFEEEVVSSEGDGLTSGEAFLEQMPPPPPPSVLPPMEEPTVPEEPLLPQQPPEPEKQQLEAEEKQPEAEPEKQQPEQQQKSDPVEPEPEKAPPELAPSSSHEPQPPPQPPLESPPATTTTTAEDAFIEVIPLQHSASTISDNSFIATFPDHHEDDLVIMKSTTTSYATAAAVVANTNAGASSAAARATTAPAVVTTTTETEPMIYHPDDDDDDVDVENVVDDPEGVYHYHHSGIDPSEHPNGWQYEENDNDNTVDDGAQWDPNHDMNQNDAFNNHNNNNQPWEQQQQPPPQYDDDGQHYYDDDHHDGHGDPYGSQDMHVDYHDQDDVENGYGPLVAAAEAAPNYYDHEHEPLNPNNNQNQNVVWQPSDLYHQSQRQVGPTKEPKQEVDYGYSKTDPPEEPSVSEAPARSTKRLWCHICCLWIIVMALVVLVVLFAMRDKNDNDDDNANASNTEPNVTKSPTVPSNLFNRSTPAPSLSPPTNAPNATMLPSENTNGTLVPSPSPSTEQSTFFPTTAVPTIIPKQCFVSTEELYAAVDMYLAGGNDAMIQGLYGWPMNNWCFADSMTSFNSVFSATRNPAIASANFNERLDSWNMSAATDLGSMFYGATAFVGNSLAGWDVSRVQNLSWTFAEASSFNGDLSIWDTSSVTEMRGTFYRATSFNQDLSIWDTSKVTVMEGTFLQATSFNQNIGYWNLSSVQVLTSMFFGATSFSQNLCAWSGFFNASKKTVNTDSMFETTACPRKDIITRLDIPVPGPFCYSCDINFDVLCPLYPDNDCSVLYKDPAAPQAKAFTFAAQSNEFTTNAKRIQRFALATLYYTTAGASWNQNQFWLTNVDECLWLQTSAQPCTSNRIMEKLELDGNGLIGMLPSEISFITSLTMLSLHNNTLLGQIPSDLGTRLSNLKQLNLQQNSFMGSIPTELGLLTNLEMIRLDGNGLTGTLPTPVCTLAQSGVLLSLDCSEVATDTCSVVNSLTCCSNAEPCP